MQRALAIFRDLGLLTEPVGRPRVRETAAQRQRRLFDDGMTIAEIARQEGVTEATVRRNLRARRKLH